MDEQTKLEAIKKMNECDGGFFLLTYDKDGHCEMMECMGDNAAYLASKLSDLLSDARMKYINWREKQIL